MDYQARAHGIELVHEGDASETVSSLHRYEQLMRTTFTREEIEGFYSRFEELRVPAMLRLEQV